MMKRAALGLILLISGCAMADESLGLKSAKPAQDALSEEVHEGLAEVGKQETEEETPAMDAEMEELREEAEAEEIVDYGTETEVEEPGYIESEVEETSEQAAE